MNVVGGKKKKKNCAKLCLHQKFPVSPLPLQCLKVFYKEMRTKEQVTEQLG